MSAPAPPFEQYCTVGLVVDAAVPFSFRHFRNKAFVAVSVGTSYVIYECGKLSVAIAAPPTSRRIRALALWKRERTVTASGDAVLVWHRSKHARTLKQKGPVGCLTKFVSCFGNRVVALSAEGQLTCWNALSSSRLGEFDLRNVCGRGRFHPTAMLHPHGYTNKVLVAGRLEAGGSLDASYPLLLVNVFSGRLVHRAHGFGASVCTLVQSPAPDVLGVGLDDGRIICHNFLYDRSVCVFLHTAASSSAARAVTAIAFQHELAPGHGFCGAALASGGSNGKIAVWDLSARKSFASVECAHNGGVGALAFLPGENVLLSAGGDNSLKLWAFSADRGELRLLKQRSGQNAPPVRIRYFCEETRPLGQSAGGVGCRILCAGRDHSFWMFHTARPEQNREMSQIPRERHAGVGSNAPGPQFRLPLIVDFAAAGANGHSWNNIVTSHMYSPDVHTWSSQQHKLGKVSLQLCHDGGFSRFRPRSSIKIRREGVDVHRPSRVKRNEALFPYAISVALSKCGNFAFVGYSSGYICQFSMQSGAVYGSLPPEPRGQHSGMVRGDYEGLCGRSGHMGPVYSLACGSINEIVVSVGHDGAFSPTETKTCTQFRRLLSHML